MPHAAAGRAVSPVRRARGLGSRPHRTAALACACFALAFAGALAQAAIYKWVDEKGVTHFSEQAPPDGKATKIETKPAPGKPQDAKPESWKDRELEFRKRRLEKEQAEDAVRTRTEREAAERRSRCLQAQRELEVLQAGVPVYATNERGERVYLEDKDRPREIQQWQRAAEAHCGR